jgi:hypothetical protein
MVHKKEKPMWQKTRPYLGTLSFFMNEHAGIAKNNMTLVSLHQSAVDFRNIKLENR